jgi:hypothetical protein
MNNINKKKFFEIGDLVKRRLFNRMREETFHIDYTNYEKYKRKLESIFNSLLQEWESIKNEYEDDRTLNLNALKGFLYEALFFYACLKSQAIFLDAEIAEFGGAKFKESPPWFEATPLYDIIPDLHHIWEAGIKDSRKRKVPQTKADFIITYVDDKGPTAIALIDVKSKKPQYNEKFNWQIIATMRRGFIFQIVYPKEGIEYPKSLEEWEVKTPCQACKNFSDDFTMCTVCGKEIFPFWLGKRKTHLKRR